MDPIATTTAASAHPPTGGKKAAHAKTKAELAAFEDKLKAAGAKLERVEGHAYEKVSGGKHDGRMLNTSGNERSGRLFELVERGGKTYHVYGSGSHRLFIGVPTKAQSSGGKAAPSS
jgi:hypothetical protein